MLQYLLDVKESSLFLFCEHALHHVCEPVRNSREPNKKSLFFKVTTTQILFLRFVFTHHFASARHQTPSWSPHIARTSQWQRVANASGLLASARFSARQRTSARDSTRWQVEDLVPQRGAERGKKGGKRTKAGAFFKKMMGWRRSEEDDLEGPKLQWQRCVGRWERREERQERKSSSSFVPVSRRRFKAEKKETGGHKKNKKKTQKNKRRRRRALESLRDWRWGEQRASAASPDWQLGGKTHHLTTTVKFAINELHLSRSHL